MIFFSFLILNYVKVKKMNDEENSKRKIDEISIEWENLEQRASALFKNLTLVFKRIKSTS